MAVNIPIPSDNLCANWSGNGMDKMGFNATLQYGVLCLTANAEELFERIE